MSAVCVILSGAKSLPRAARGDLFLRMTIAAAVLLSPVAALRTEDLSAQLQGQSFEVTPQTVDATVGDTVTLQLRLHLHERDLLLDTLPRVSTLPRGVRVFSIEKLSRGAGRVYQGSARAAFYRPGRQPIPVFELPFMRVVEGVSRATLASSPGFIEIASILPAGNPALRDIQELEPSTLSPWPLAAAMILGAGALYLLLRRRHRKPAAEPVAQEHLPAPASASDPFHRALQELRRVEQERWPEQGQVGLHYETVVDVLRRYLDEAEGVGARERTTLELLWALPPHLTGNGLRGRCHQILAEADLVKFAAVRPSVPDASDFLAAARQLVRDWHHAAPRSLTSDALR
jgi:hypothetical protein